MIIRTLPKPTSFLCIAARNLCCYRSNHPVSPLRSKHSPHTTGIFKVNLVNNLNIRPLSYPMSSSLSENQMHQIDKLLTGTEDDHGGVIVEMTTEPLDPSAFTSLLRASISHWKHQGKKGIWIKLPIECVNLVEAIVKEGFYYHHAEPKYLMLVHWIPETANTLPANATHRVGIGAFVLNEKGEVLCPSFIPTVVECHLPGTFKLSGDRSGCLKDGIGLTKYTSDFSELEAPEVLVVQEKTGIFRGTGFWKFPTGVVDEGEDICAAAVREVKEETGIVAEFKEILAFRQSHKSFFEKSDLFFVCMLQPLSFDIQKEELEIEAAEWMPFDEYAAQPFVQKHELLKYIVDICLAKKEREYTGFTPVHMVTRFSEKHSFLYLNRQHLNRP